MALTLELRLHLSELLIDVPSQHLALCCARIVCIGSALELDYIAAILSGGRGEEES